MGWDETVARAKNKSEKKFLKAVKDRGFTLVGKYTLAVIGVELICPRGHKCSPTPANFTHKRRPVGCLRCSILKRTKGYL